MTKHELNNMMKEAGPIVRMPFDQWCERFANLVAAHKAEVITAEAYRCGYEDGMEAGAVICDNVASKYQHGHYPGAETIADECAGNIRSKK